MQNQITWRDNKLQIGNGAANRLNVGNTQFSFGSLGVANQSQGFAVPTTQEASNSPNFSLLKMLSQGETFCRIDKDGRLLRNEIDITDNDKAMAECFVDYLKKFQNVEVKRGS